MEHGEKVLIVTRRLFAGEPRRHFVGFVERYDSAAIRASGYAFVYDVKKSSFVRRKNLRTRIFPLDNQIIIYLIPQETDIGSVRYETSEESGLVATDGKHFRLDMSEFHA
jgi:hypothetical protein